MQTALAGNFNDAPALRQAEVEVAVNTVTDLAKGAASVVLTEPGLTNIMALVEQGRTIYQRILTWINQQDQGDHPEGSFCGYRLRGDRQIRGPRLCDAAGLHDGLREHSLATGNVRPSKKPETWNIGGFITVLVVLVVDMVVETLLLLWIAWSHFDLATNNNALYTFSFLMLLYFAVFSVVSARERRWFWSTLPSKTFLSAIAGIAWRNKDENQLKDFPRAA